MERRVTPNIAPGRADSGPGTEGLGPHSGNASGRIAVTQADEGVAPAARSATHIGTPASTGASVGVAELTHDLVRGQFSDYLSGALGEVARRRVDGHLAVCPPCAAFLDTLRVTVRALGQLPASKAPTGARARILEQARQDHGAPRADA